MQFALVLNEKKKKIADVLAGREAVVAELEDARARMADMGLGDEGRVDSGSGWEPGGSSGDDDDDDDEVTPASARAAQSLPQLPHHGAQLAATQSAPLETTRSAGGAGWGRSRGPKVKYETPAVAAAASAGALLRQASSGSQQPASRARSAPVAALAHIQHFASLASKDESDSGGSG